MSILKSIATVAVLTFTAATPSFAVRPQAIQGVAAMALYHLKCEHVPRIVELKMSMMLNAMTQQERKEADSYGSGLELRWAGMSPKAQRGWCTNVKPEVERMNQ
jgi:hypothetical protein